MKTEKEILQTNMTEEARKQGFGHMAFLPVEQLVFVPEYRKYCEQNLCGRRDEGARLSVPDGIYHADYPGAGHRGPG